MFPPVAGASTKGTLASSAALRGHLLSRRGTCQCSQPLRERRRGNFGEFRYIPRLSLIRRGTCQCSPALRERRRGELWQGPLHPATISPVEEHANVPPRCRSVDEGTLASSATLRGHLFPVEEHANVPPRCGSDPLTSRSHSTTRNCSVSMILSFASALVITTMQSPGSTQFFRFR